MRKLINALRFLKFLKKAETYQKYQETDLKFEEIDQQTEILKYFVKSGNKSKILNLKFEDTDKKLRFLKFLKKAETHQKYEETEAIFLRI